MLKYLYLALVCIFFSVQFIFYKLYQFRTDGKIAAATRSLLATAVTVLLFLTPFGIKDFKLDTTAVIIAFIYAIGFIVSTIATLPALKMGTLTTVTTFTLTGSIVLPFVYGIYLGEEIGITRIVGVALILLSLVPDVLSSAISKKSENASVKTEIAKKSRASGIIYIILCFSIFFANGAAATATKMVKVMSPDIPDFSYLTLTAVIRLVVSVGILALLALIGSKKAKESAGKEPKPSAPKKSVMTFAALAFATLYALSNLLGTVFNLECAKIMDSSFLFPVSNAAIIIGTTLISIFIFKEKVRLNNIAGVLLALAGIIVYAL